MGGWTTVLSDKNISHFNLQGGPKLPRNIDMNSSPLEYFYLMLSESIYTDISNESNKYAELCKHGKGKTDSIWYPIDAAEIKAYMGLSILMGINPMPEYTDYLSTEIFIGNCGFQDTMTLKRYQKLTL